MKSRRPRPLRASGRSSEGSGSPRRLRILLVGKGPPERGGIPSVIEVLMNGLAGEHDPHFLNLSRAGAPEGGRLSLSNVRRTVGDVGRVWRESPGYDIVHLHSALAPTVTVVRAGLLALAARLRGAIVVVHGHGGMIQRWFNTPVRRLLARVALLPAAHTVAVSTGGLEKLGTLVGRGRLSLIDNGVYARRFVPVSTSHDPPRVLYAGVLTPRKGLVDLLVASDLLIRRDVLHRVWLVGGMPDEGPAAEAAVRAAVEERGDLVHMAGRLSTAEMPGAYSEGDIFCLPSWWEAMPLSVLEAMAAGLPVVATDVGDVHRIVGHGETGLIVPPRRPDLLAEALESLLENRGLRQDFGAAGRRRIEDAYTADRMIEQVALLYRSLVRP